MTTYGNLKTRALRAVDDTGGSTWSEALVYDLLGEATEDYALHIAPRFTTDISTSANVRTYALAGDRPRGVYSVEYPQGEDPPCYLLQRSFLHPDFWEVDGYYAFIDWGTEQSEKQLYISTRPGDAETIRVQWTGRFDITNPPAEEDACPVPEQHQHILLAYVFWKLLLHQLAQESQAPAGTDTVEIMRQLSTNAERAEQAYRRAIQDAQRHIAHSGPAGSRWRMDKWDG